MLFAIACTGNIDLFDRMVEQFKLSPNVWNKVRLRRAYDLKLFPCKRRAIT